MKSDSQSNQMRFLTNKPGEMYKPEDPFRNLAIKIDWTEIEFDLNSLYSGERRPAKPIKLMTD